MILYDPIKNTLSNSIRTIKVGYRESQILSVLLEHSPDVVKKQFIIQHAWESEYIGETSLAKSISVLRQTFIKLGIKESPIITVPKIGYRLASNVVIDKKESSAVSKTVPEAQTIHDIVKPQPKAFLPTANQLKPHKNNALYSISVSLLILASYIGFNKFQTELSYHDGKQYIKNYQVGKLEVFQDIDQQPDKNMLTFLSENQCDCAVFIDRSENYSTLAWLSKKSKKSINIYFKESQLDQVSNEIKEFIKETEL